MPRPAQRRAPVRRTAIAAAQERFLAAPDAPLPELDVIRPVVLDSWRRSLRLGVDPCDPAPPVPLDGEALAAYRETHPLAPLMPLVRRLLADGAEEAGHIVAVGDADGRLLWVEGDRRLRVRAERMHFVEGALWSEGGAGTNAPGTALAVAAPVQISSVEHFGAVAHPWSCVASPVRDPLTGAVLGVVDLTGGDHVAQPVALQLVRACAAALEAQLVATARASSPARNRSRLVPRRGPTAPAGRPPGDDDLPRTGRPVATLRLLGTDAATLVLPVGPTADRRLTLSLRHSEMLWLLARSRTGLTVQALDAGLHPDGAHLVTVRAEVARLRRVLGTVDGAEVLTSRPYRLAVPVRTDVDDVRRLLARGAVRKALDLVDGAPLPSSEAPAVRAAREEFMAELRQAVLAGRSVPALEAWTAGEAGHDDAEAWDLLEACLPYGSPKRATVRAHRARLRA